MTRSLAFESLLVLCGLSVGCASPIDRGDDEQLASTEQALVDGCRLAALGTRCDPGTGDVCAGRCERSSESHFLRCVAVAPETNEGLPCAAGTSEHVSCSRSCRSGVCTETDAVDGAACKPAGAPLVSAICDGVCQGGACEWVVKPDHLCGPLVVGTDDDDDCKAGGKKGGKQKSCGGGAGGGGAGGGGAGGGAGGGGADGGAGSGGGGPGGAGGGVDSGTVGGGGPGGAGGGGDAGTGGGGGDDSGAGGGGYDSGTGEGEDAGGASSGDAAVDDGGPLIVPFDPPIQVPVGETGPGADLDGGSQEDTGQSSQGIDGDTSDDGGCGCRAAATTRVPAAAWLGVVSVVLARWRRRAR